MNLEQAIRTITTHCHNRTALLAELDQQTDTGIRAAAYDTDGPSAGTDQPPRPDPTGETATRPDRARTLRNQLLPAEANITYTTAAYTRLIPPNIHTAANALPHINPTNQDAHRIDHAAQTIQRITVETLNTRPPTPKDLAHLAADGQPGCQSCARIKWWNDPNYNTGRPTNLGGLLPEPWLLCRPCQTFTINNDRPPTRNELDHRRNNPRGHWPTRHTTNT
jgi:hypothetical protein